MILKTARVENFKCIRDSGEFKLDPRVTCLVGKNESGKTALLQALYKLNPVVETKFEDMEYPRYDWSRYNEERGASHANVLTTVWTLLDSDKAELVAIIGPAGDQIQEVTITKGFGNVRLYRCAINEADVVKHLLNSHQLGEPEKTALAGVSTIKALKEKLVAVQAPSSPAQTLISFLQQHFVQGTANEAVAEVLDKRLPKMIYFAEYMRLAGQMAMEDFKANRQNAAHPKINEYRMFDALLGLVNRKAEDIEKINQFDPLQADLEAVSSRLTRTIFNYWSQNKHLRVQFRFDMARAGDLPPFNAGWIMRTRIENTRHDSTTSFDERSSGFVWFFSFLVWFSQMQKNYGKDLVLLLDEPGNSLHAKAQADLLRYIEEQLAPKCQVLYTTHSPFMVDAENILRARTVEDVVVVKPDRSEEFLGTKVNGDVLSTDKDTVFPLQAALGYEITQTLFVGKDNLLVEGPSDLLYLKWFQQELARRGRPTLDRRWTIAPCGGIDKVASFMSLFRGNNLHVAVLTDYKHGDKKKTRDLVESKLLAAGHVFTADVYAGQPEADVEDILGPTLYAALVNETYGLKEKSVIRLAKPVVGEAPSRIVPQVEAAFREMPMDIPEFDHYAPAEHLISRVGGSALPGLEEALARFEKLFAGINACLDAAKTGPEVTVRPVRAAGRTA